MSYWEWWRNKSLILIYARVMLKMSAQISGWSVDQYLWTVLRIHIKSLKYMCKLKPDICHCNVKVFSIKKNVSWIFKWKILPYDMSVCFFGFVLFIFFRIYKKKMNDLFEMFPFSK